MSYEATYTRPYEGGYKNLPSEDTIEMAEFINKRDDTLIKIEEYLSSGQLALSERKIAGKDLTDDITAEELKEALGVDALETDLDNAKVAIRNQGVMLKQTQDDVKERIKKFYTNNVGEQFSADTDDGLVRDLIVGGVSEQFTTTGAQLLDLHEIIGTNVSNGITVNSLGDGSYTYSGTATESIINVWFLGYYNAPTSVLTLEPGTYYIKDVCLYKTASGNEDAVIDDGSGTIFTITEQTNYAGVRAKAAIRGNVYNEVIYPMLAKCDTALPWEPYTGGVASPNPEFPQEIKKTIVSEIKTHGKNLFNKNEIYKENYYCQLTGYTYYDAWDVYRIKVKPLTTYTVSKTYTSDIFYYSVSKDGALTVISSAEHSTITTFANTAYVDVSVRKVNKDLFQFEEGAVATTYEPYTEHSVVLSEPIELNGIGNAQDVIDVENGVVKRIFEEDVFDGSDDEGWAKSATTGTNRYYVFLDDILASLNCNFLCSQARKVNTTSTTENFVAFITPAKQFAINTNFSALAEWKAHLQANPMKVVYELADEVIEPLPVADQIALKDLPTYYGGTYILSDSEVEATFDYNYPCSIENFVEYIKEQIGDTREFNYNMEQRITNEEYLSALAFVNSEYSIALTEMGV